MVHDLTASQRTKIDAYVAMLLAMNKKMNLTGASSTERVWSELITPALGFLPHIAGKSIADIGSGNGIPGVIIKICRPDFRVTLIEIRKKRTAFLHEVAYALSLEIEIIEARAEQVSNRKFSTVVGFRVAPLADFLVLAKPMLDKAGVVVQHAPDAVPGSTVRIVDKQNGIWYYNKGDDNFLVAQPCFT